MLRECLEIIASEVFKGFGGAVGDGESCEAGSVRDGFGW